MSEPRLSLLLVEGEPSLAELWATGLRDQAKATIAPSLQQGREKLASAPFDAVLLDLRLPDGDGANLLVEIGEAASAIIIADANDRDSAVATLDRGASDYLLKPCGIAELQHRLARIATLRKLAAENAVLRQATNLQTILTLAEMEWRMIESALHATGGNKTAAARRLGISLRTLYNKLDAKLAKS